VIAFYESMKGQPCFIGMQAEGREWMQMITRKAASCSITHSPIR